MAAACLLGLSGLLEAKIPRVGNSSYHTVPHFEMIMESKTYMYKWHHIEFFWDFHTIIIYFTSVVLIGGTIEDNEWEFVINCSTEY